MKAKTFSIIDEFLKDKQNLITNCGFNPFLICSGGEDVESFTFEQVPPNKWNMH